MSEVAAPSDVVLVFVGPINYPATKSLRSVACFYANKGVSRIHLHISSQGGSVFEGCALYNFLRSLPVEVLTHNIGTIESIAMAVFLAGARRTCCPESRFMFHSFEWNYAGAQALLPERLKEHALSVEADHDRFVSILKSRTAISGERLDALKIFDQANLISPATAQEMGIVQEVKDAPVPAGAPVLNVEW